MTRDAIDGCREKKSNESPPPIQERRSFEEHNAAVIVMRNAHTGGPQRQLKMTLRILLTSLLCCTCILTQSSLGQEEQTANGVRTIQGTVLNSVTRAPIARALVSSGNRIGALTDSEGHFEFAWPDENSFSGLVAPAPGSTPASPATWMTLAEEAAPSRLPLSTSSFTYNPNR